MIPKVLILNQPFNNRTGGGITLSNLFRGWDKDKLAVICHNYLLENVDTSICSTYYQIGFEEHKFYFPFSVLKRKHQSGIIKFHEIKTPKAQPAKSKLRMKLITSYFNPILKYFGLTTNFSKIELSPKIKKWLDDFSPDIIYAQASGREGLKFISLIHSYLQKPLIFHMMDDWLFADKGFLRNYLHKKNNQEFKKLIDRASFLMSISDAMAEEYEKRYEKVFTTFHNPIELEFWNRYQRVNYNISESPTILYAGRIGLGINDSLQLIAKAVQQANNVLQMSAKFIIQSMETPSWISRYECVEHRDIVSYDELPKVFSSADFLILPYDFSSQSLNYIRYSMPTKASEYMISGTPIIILAPEETAVVKYAKKYKWARIITKKNVNELRDSIIYLIKNESERVEIAQNAMKLAEENHESVKVTNKFRNIIYSFGQHR